ncbi:hypothetical protein ACJX0J_031223, partial [Zea mays]
NLIVWLDLCTFSIQILLAGIFSSVRLGITQDMTYAAVQAYTDAYKPDWERINFIYLDLSWAQLSYLS